MADDESRHLSWCLQRLEELGHEYGELPSHNLLWEGAQMSSGDLGARLAIVPMSQEARGLDAGPRLVERLTGHGDGRSAAIVAAIASEERAHVAVGVAWFSGVCSALDVPGAQTYRRWLACLCPDLLKGPFNHASRAEVGMPRDWYDISSWPTHDREAISSSRKRSPKKISSGQSAEWIEANSSRRQPLPTQEEDGAAEFSRVSPAAVTTGPAGAAGMASNDDDRADDAAQLFEPPILCQDRLEVLRERLRCMVSTERSMGGALC